MTDADTGVMPENRDGCKALLALADRCEAATGPDRELDRDIFELTVVGQGRLANDEKDILATEARYGAGWLKHIELFTVSIDAAMTLVPNEWFVELCRDRHFECQWSAVLHPPIASRFTAVEGYGSLTPALTLCAAALRARAAMP